MTESLLLTGALWLTILQVRGRLKPVPCEACALALGLTLFVALVAPITAVSLIAPKTLRYAFLWEVYSVLHKWTWIAALWAAHLSYPFTCSSRRIQAAIGGFLILAALCTTLLHAAGIRFIEYTQVYSFQGYYRPHGILLTPLEAGMVGLLGWAWGLGWSMEKNAKQAAGLFLTGLSTATIYLTFSRSAWVGLGIAMLVGLLWARVRAALWKPFLVTMITFVLCSLGLPTGWQRGVYAAQGDQSVQSRIESWSEFPIQLIRYPFGVAGGSTDMIVQDIGFSSVVNFYLDMGLQHGVLPFVLMLWLVGLLLLYVWRCGQRGSRACIWGLGIVASVVCLVFMNPSWDSLASALWGGFWGMVSAMEVKPDATTRVHTD
jgi:O-antigen ligase